MAEPSDPTFFQRSDDHINLSNQQLSLAEGPRVAASMSFATARFNTWLCANMYGSSAEMQRMRQEAVTRLSDHYRKMLEDSFDDYISNFSGYVPEVSTIKPRR